MLGLPALAGDHAAGSAPDKWSARLPRSAHMAWCSAKCNRYHEISLRSCETKCGTVDAPALPGRGRAIVKHMPLMATTAAAMRLCPRITEHMIRRSAHGVGDRCIETGPASAAVEFGARRKEWERAASAIISAGPAFAIQLVRMRSFCPRLPQHVILHRCQPLSPLGIRQAKRKAVAVDAGLCSRGS